MKVPSQNINLDVNLNRVSTNSRTFYKKDASLNQIQQDSIFNTREFPIPQDNNFVVVDGKKLNLNARRGTYVNLIV